MKHLHVINKPIIGGAENIAAKLAIEFSNRELFVLSSRFHLQDKFERKFNVKIKKLQNFLKKILQNEVTVFTHNLQAHIVITLICLVLKLFGKKVRNCNVIHFDTVSISMFWLILLYVSTALGKPRLIFVSEFAKVRFFQRLNVKNIENCVIHNGIDNKFYDLKSDDTLPPLSDNFSIGFIGRHAPVKRLELFLEICQHLVETHFPDMIVIIQSDIANHQLGHLLKLHATSLELADIILLPGDQDQSLFYKKSDIVISTSLTETFCLIGVEALASGKRFYAYNLECIEMLFSERELNFGAAAVEEFCERLVIEIQDVFKIPNLSTFSERAMLKRYGQIE